MYYDNKPDEVFSLLDSDKGGLSSASASERLSIYGRNRLSEKPARNPFLIFLDQFKSALVIILLIAAVISAAVGEIVDSAVIFAIVVLNSLLSLYLTLKAEKSIRSLKGMLSHKANVLRNNMSEIIDAELLVPGDIVLLESGSTVPADIYIFNSVNLHVDQSSLTGESVAVGKQSGVQNAETPVTERTNMVFMGTIITMGRATGIVTATGMQTEFGRIAGLAKSIDTGTTRLQLKLDILGRKLGIASVLIAFAIFVLGLFQERELLSMFLVGVSLAVAVIPEGLPAVVTITLALGVRNMINRNCLIRNLSATETLGEISVICTDKTGTLTKNEMTVRSIYCGARFYTVTGEGYQPEGKILSEEAPADDAILNRLILTGMLCNNTDVFLQDGKYTAAGTPTEGALVTLGMKYGISSNERTRNRSFAKEIEFTSSRKRMTSIYLENGSYCLYCKGAPEQILACSALYASSDGLKELTPAVKVELEDVYYRMAGEGLRIIALGYRMIEDPNLSDNELEDALIFLGFTGISDPPRPEVREAVEKCRDAGIEVIMITGDSPVTARSIGREIGISTDNAVCGVEIDRMNDYELGEILKKCRVFARVTPEHKFRIVKQLQMQGHVTAMTGDGVNDSPALKQSDVGIAMGIKGTDVAKDASDMILTDDNFASIVDGVEEGRRQYENIRRFTNFIISANFGEIITILLAMLMHMPVILFAVQILWINLATDSALALALGTDRSAPDSMKRPPRPHNTDILNRETVGFLLFMGLWIGGLTAGIFYFMLKAGLPEAEARSAAFIGLIIFEMIHMFNFREADVSVFRKSYLDNKSLNIAWLATFAAQLVIIYWQPAQDVFYTRPLSMNDWFFISLAGLSIILMAEIYRVLRNVMIK